MRNSVRVTAVWPSGSPTSSALPVDFGYYAAGTMAISGAWTNAAVGIQTDMYPGVPFHFLDSQAGYTGVSLPSASGNAYHAMPVEWFYAHGENTVHLWSHNGSGSGVPQAGARTVILDLKD